MSRIHVVLHRPIYTRNVGMCARAMANMGADRLILIAPRSDISRGFPEEAKQGAAHAQAVLREATIYPSLEAFQATEGEGLRIALSGRDGRLNRPEGLTEVLDRIKGEPEHPAHRPQTPIYLMFGTEDDGLSNEEMALCHHVCWLPTFGEITSLNLSHAVLLTLYMVQFRFHAGESASESRSSSSLPRQPIYYPSQTIKSWLEALGFDLSARRVSIEKTLNRILLSRSPDPEELRILDKVLQQTVRRLIQGSRSGTPSGETPDPSSDL